ncbi:MAG: hypothetical protein Q9183_003846 [Haloplaca sp. 2 TL-2023]
MISEIAIFEASDPNLDLSKSESPYKATLRQHLKTVLAFDGAQAAYFGQVIEKPHIVVIFVNWDSLDSHLKAKKSPYAISTSDIASYLFDVTSGISDHEASFRTNLTKDNGLGKVFHVPFSENMLDALQPKTSAGTIGDTELVFAPFQPSPLSQAAKDTIMESFAHVEPVIMRHGALTGYRKGWALESLDTPLLEKGDGEDTGKCDYYVNLTGWDKMESHQKMMETQEFKDNQHWFMDVEGIRGGEIVHARFYEA